MDNEHIASLVTKSALPKQNTDNRKARLQDATFSLKQRHPVKQSKLYATRLKRSQSVWPPRVFYLFFVDIQLITDDIGRQYPLE
jgi:hypothetical protein